MISQPTELPRLIAAYVAATNRGDSQALIDLFVDDALVNDQLHDHWGREAILDWVMRDVVGENISMQVLRSIEHYGHVVLTAAIDGSFDKRGLPDPLLLSFYFAPHHGRIAQLFILPCQLAC